MLVGISTGGLYPRLSDINKEVEFFRESESKIDGLELSFSRLKKVMDSTKSGVLKLTEENEKYVRQLKFNTIHLPWLDVDYSDTESRFLSILSELYCRLDSKVAVIHPDCVKTLETYDSLQKLFPNLAVENMTPRKSKGHLIEHLREITEKNKKLGVVLDFAHCMESKESFEMYERAFYNRIAEIHISASKKALYNDESGSTHIRLHGTKIRPSITKKDVPIIIEGKVSTVEELEKEINFIRNL